ncbi:hypothetical protein, partial [Roseomonas sp. SXEYE001]
MTVVTAELGLLPNDARLRPQVWIGNTITAQVTFRNAARQPTAPSGPVTFLWRSPESAVMELPGVPVDGRPGVYQCSYQAPLLGLWAVQARSGLDGAVLDWSEFSVEAEPPGGSHPNQAIWLTSPDSALVSLKGTHLAGLTIPDLPQMAALSGGELLVGVQTDEDGSQQSRSVTVQSIRDDARAAMAAEVATKVSREFAIPAEGAVPLAIEDRLADTPSTADFGASPDQADNGPLLSAAGARRRILRAKPGDLLFASTMLWDQAVTDAALRGEGGAAVFKFTNATTPGLHIRGRRTTFDGLHFHLISPKVKIPGNDAEGIALRERASAIYLDKYAEATVRNCYFQDSMIGVHLPSVSRAVPIEQRDHNWGVDVSWNKSQNADFLVLGNGQKQFTFIGNKSKTTTMNADGLPPHQLYLSGGSIPGFYNLNVGVIAAFNQDFDNPHSSSWKVRLSSSVTMVGNQSDSAERIMDLVNVTRPIVLGTQGWDLVDKIGDTQQAAYGVDDVSWGLWAFNTTWMGDDQNNIIGAVIEHGSRHNFFFGNLYRSKKLDLSQGSARPLIRFNDSRDNVVERPILVVEGPADYLVRLDRENNQLRLPTVVAPAGSVI